MTGTQWVRTAITICVISGGVIFCSGASAELKPGEVLNATTWQQAKELMPEAILRRFANGQHISQVISLPPEALQYGTRFRQLTEANQGKYDVDARGVLIDISALDLVDSFIGRTISNIAGIAKVLDAVTVVGGMRPAVAITLVELGMTLAGIKTALTLERGLALIDDALAASD